MEFIDIKTQYKDLGIFNNFLTVKDAKYLEIIPEKYWDYFPDRCVCGSENIITNDLQQPQCCNPRCKIKQSYALSELFQRYGCNGLGPAKCLTMYEALLPQFKMNSYIECLSINYKDYPASVYGSMMAIDFFDACKKILTTATTFPELISKIGIPSISSKAYQLFDSINNFNQFRDTVVEEGGLINFCFKRGIKDKSVIFWLNECKVEIALASTLVNNYVRPAGLVKQNICITGSINLNGQRMTKKEFVNYCNSLTFTSDGVQLMEIIMNSGKATASHIIADSTANTAKYVAGKNRGKERDIDGVLRNVLMTSSEYVETIKEICKKWNQEIKQDLSMKNSENQTMNQKQDTLANYPDQNQVREMNIV